MAGPAEKVTAGRVAIGPCVARTRVEWAAPAKPLLHIALILALAWLALRASRKLIRALRECLARHQES